MWEVRSGNELRTASRRKEWSWITAHEVKRELQQNRIPQQNWFLPITYESGIYSQDAERNDIVKTTLFSALLNTNIGARQLLPPSESVDT